MLALAGAGCSTAACALPVHWDLQLDTLPSPGQNQAVAKESRIMAQLKATRANPQRIWGC